MNVTNSILERQNGNLFWKEYDTAIKRLHCLKINDYQGISYNVNDLSVNEESPILACKFSRSSGNENLVALANEDGKFAICNTNAKNITMINNVLAHHNAIFDIEWLSKDTRIITASGDYTVRLWNVTESSILSEKIYLGHTRSVKTVTSSCTDSSIFASGARDGIIIIWDRRSHAGSDLIPRPDNIINYYSSISTPNSMRLKRHSSGNSITGLVFQDDKTLISCTSSDGTINVWDTRKSYSVLKRTPLPKYTLPYAGNTFRNGFTDLVIDHDSRKLYASCLDNNIYCYNISTYNPTPVMKYTGHQIQNSFYIKSSLSPDGLYLISGSKDDRAYIWNVKKRLPLVSLNGHTTEVSCVAWSPKGDLKIITCSDDSKYKIWKVGPEFIDDNDADLKVTGHAEIVENKCTDNQHFTSTRLCKRIMLASPVTPTSGCSASKQRCVLCSNCLSRSSGSGCENCKTKRNMNNLLDSSNSLKRKMNDCSFGENSKRPRRLFSPIKELVESDFNILASELEPTTDLTSTSNLGIDNVCDDTSDCYFSPTRNLPNFVLDGRAPHLNVSPQKKHNNNNWLLKIRKEKEFMQSITKNNEPIAPKIMKLDINSAEYSSKTPKRKNTKKSPGRTPKSSNELKDRSPLLKFFKYVTNHKENKK